MATIFNSILKSLEIYSKYQAYYLLRWTQIYLTHMPFFLNQGIWIKHWEVSLISEQINSFMNFTKGKRICYGHNPLCKMLSSSFNFDLFSIINESNGGGSHKSGGS